MSRLLSSLNFCVRTTIAVALITLAASRDCPLTRAGLVASDNFDTAHTYWDGSSVNVAGTIWDGVLYTGNANSVNASVTQPGRLVIDMNANDSRSDGTPSNNRPYTATTLYLDVAGDFDAWVQIPSFQADNQYENQGLVAYDANNSVVEVMNIYLGGTPVEQSRFRSSESGTLGTIGTTSSQESWLRLSRAGNVFEGFYGNDGANWTSYGTVSRVDLDGLPVKLGLFASTANELGSFQAQFDNFTIIPEPSTLLLLAAAALVLLRRRRCR